MPRNRRDRRNPNGMVVHVTARVYKGLPFAARQSMHMVVEGLMARAQMLYPVTICAFIFMGNHHHFIFAGDGNRISAFMGYLQGEIAKAYKRFVPEMFASQGFWEGRFHEQRLADANAVIDKLIYLYSNPISAKLVHTIDDYPGLTSYAALKQGAPLSRLCPFVPIRACQSQPFTYSRSKDLNSARKLLSRAVEFLELKIDPFAWLKCFKTEISQVSARQLVLEGVRTVENAHRNIPMMGAQALVTRPLNRPFSPESKSRTPFLQASCPELRRSAIESYRNFCKLCREAWFRFQRRMPATWPRGAFFPSTRVLPPVGVA
jgi:REP element-mobilizing transposase RayT